MIRCRLAILFATFLLALPGFGQDAAALKQLSLVPLGGIDASLKIDTVATITFQKTAAGRRLLALSQDLKDVAEAKAVDVSWKLTGSGEARPAIVVYEAGGGAWFKVLGSLLEPGDWEDRRLPLTGLRETAFSQDEDHQLDLSKAEKLWVGVTLDGEAKGTLAVRQMVMSSEVYRPTKPLSVAIGDPKSWAIGQDPAVKSAVKAVPEGPAGETVIRLDYTFPGGRHMYFIPAVPIKGEELDGYRALRFRYKATAPDGPHLLFMLQEPGGGQWIVDPPMPLSADWTTVDVPLEKLKLGSWSNDANKVLDMMSGIKVATGIHGVATATGSGAIWVQSIELVP